MLIHIFGVLAHMLRFSLLLAILYILIIILLRLIHEWLGAQDREEQSRQNK